MQGGNHSQTHKGSEVPPRKSQDTFAVDFYFISHIKIAKSIISLVHLITVAVLELFHVIYPSVGFQEH